MLLNLCLLIIKKKKDQQKTTSSSFHELQYESPTTEHDCLLLYQYQFSVPHQPANNF
jgi:hypothetical protein